MAGTYLMEINRDGQVLAAVSPQERLQGEDQLVFVGVVESVVSDSCPLVGMTIRDGRFRSLYNAVVIAVARNGERLHKKIGDIVVQSGDTLLLEARPSFVRATALLGAAGDSPWMALALVYGVTMLLTEMVTNNAPAALMCPIAMATAPALGVHPMPFAIVIMMAASCSFATPIGYQTNWLSNQSYGVRPGRLSF